IGQLKLIAENYVIVRVWKSRAKEKPTSTFNAVAHLGRRGFNFGHVSLQIVNRDKNCYISHWPGEDSASPFEGVAAQEKRTLEDDIKSEGSRVISKLGRRRDF